MRPTSTADLTGWAVSISLALVAAGGPFSYMFGQPAYSTGDEPVHVDYAYELWHGHFPSFSRGMELHNHVGDHPSVQWVSHHPPLFYLLLAPVIGPLADAGHTILAVMWARAVMVLMSVVTVFVVRWMVRAIVPDAPVVATLAALLTALASWFPRQGGSVYNDMLAVLMLATATGFLTRTMREPQRRDWLIGFWASCAAGGLTRFSLLPQLLTLVIILLVHRWWVERRGWRLAWRDPVTTVVVVLATSGWWYVRNYRLTGNFQGEHFAWFRGNVDVKPPTVGAVISSGGEWNTMLEQYFSTRFLADAPSWDEWRWRAELWLLIIPLLLGLVALGSHLYRTARAGGEARTTLLLTVLMVVLIFSAVGMQIAHLALGNHNLPRYFLPIMPFVATIIAFGFTRLRFGALLLVAWVVVRLPAFSIEVRATIDRVLRPPQASIHPGWSWTGYWVAVAATVVLTTYAVTAVARDRAALRAAERPSAEQDPEPTAAVDPRGHAYEVSA